MEWESTRLPLLGAQFEELHPDREVLPHLISFFAYPLILKVFND